jgi:hypothetical protein
MHLDFGRCSVVTVQGVGHDKVYDQLWGRLWGIPISGSWNQASQKIRGIQLRFGNLDLDTDLAFPNLQMPMTASLLAVAKMPMAVSIRFEADWQSDHGGHRSVADFAVVKKFDDVEITATWEQHLPSPTTRNLVPHTGGARFDDHHKEVLKQFYYSGRPLARMLAGRTFAEIKPEEFADVARAVKQLLPS